MLHNEDALLKRHDFRALMALLAGGAIVSIAAVVATRRFLYADSSLFLLGMLESGTFYVPNTGRWFGFVVSQWLPVSAMQLGVRDPSLIATLFGINLWLNPVLAVAGAWWASGRSREVTLAVALCVLFLFQSTYVVLDNEGNVFFLLVAPFLVLTLRRDFPGWALLLLVPMLFTHAVAMLALGPIAAALLLFRKRYRPYYGDVRFWSLVAGTALVAAYQAYLVIGPEAGSNRSYFIQGAVSLPGSPTLVLTTIAFAALAWHAFRPGRWPTRALASSLTLLLLLAFAMPQLLWPAYHYRARILNAVLALALCAYLHGRVLWGLPAPSALSGRRLAFLALTLFAFQGKMTWEWHRHMKLFRAELAEARGVVAFPSEGAMVEPRSLQFSWSWTSPTRSIVFQAMERGEVRAIMLNADTTLWQPFRPDSPEELPDLSWVGVSYAPELGERGAQVAPPIRPSSSGPSE